MAGVTKPMKEPEKFENCISSYVEDDFLVIDVRTNRPSSEYFLHTVFLFRHGDNKEQKINNLSVSVLMEGYIFRIKIRKSIIKYEKYSIRVLLNNQKRSFMEFYVS